MSEHDNTDNDVKLSARQAPVPYSVNICSGYDGRVTWNIQGVDIISGRSRAKVVDEIRQIADFLENATDEAIAAGFGPRRPA